MLARIEWYGVLCTSKQTTWKYFACGSLQGSMCWHPETLWEAMGRAGAATAREMTVLNCADFSLEHDVDAAAFIKG